MTTLIKPAAEHPSRFMPIESMSPELIAIGEVLKCERSASYFIIQHGVVEVREVGMRPLREVIWPFQRKFVNLMETLDRMVVLKARQIGISTLLMHYAYWRIRFGKPNSEHVLVLSKSKDDASKVLMAKVPMIHAAMPPELAMAIESQNSFFFKLANGNTITVLAATEAGGRGHAATVIFLDEHAFHGSAETNWAALQPTLEGAGKFFVVSTGNGIGNLFHDLYQKAKAGKNSFTPVFINWSAPAHRNDAWLKAQQGDSVVDETLFKQEYPDNDNEAFAATGNSPFDLEYVVDRLTASLSVTPKIGHAGRTRIWAERVAGYRYAAGLDMAHGVTRKGIPDSTSLTIIDQFDRKVAGWDGKVELSEAAPEIAELLLHYSAFLVIERNGPGSGFIAALQAHGFNNFYRWEESHLYPDAPLTKNPTIGITRTQAVKARQVAMLVAMVNTRTLQTDDDVFWRQASTYVQNAPMQWGPQGKNKDDSLDSMMHALWGRMHMPRRVGPRKKAKKIRWGR